MSDPLTDFESRLESAIQAYLDRPELKARPSAIVADVVGRPVPSRSRLRALVAAAMAGSALVLFAAAVVLWQRWPDSGTAPGSSSSPAPTSAVAPAPTPSPLASPRTASPNVTSSPAIPSPSPSLGSLTIKTVPAFEREYRIGGMDLTLRGDRLVDTAGGALLSRGFFRPWLPVDRATLVAGARFETITTRRDSIWIADLLAGRLIPIIEGDPLLLLDVRDERVLVGTPGSLLVLDHDGRELGALAEEGPTGVFLADGAIAVTARGRIAVWDGASDSVSWSRLPPGLGRYTIAAAGVNVVAIGHSGDQRGLAAMLVDPRTGQRIGDAWRAGAGWTVGVSPDGSRFVVDVITDGARGALEVRDSATGDVIARNASRPLGHADRLFWPTENVILALRSDTGTARPPVPELYLADAFAEAPLAIEPLLEAEQASYFGNAEMIVVVSQEGDVLLVSASQAAAEQP